MVLVIPAQYTAQVTSRAVCIASHLVALLTVDLIQRVHHFTDLGNVTRTCIAAISGYKRPRRFAPYRLDADDYWAGRRG